MKWLSTVWRLLVAVIFVFSALSKLLAADAFEVYIYQQGFLSFDWSSWLARVLVSFEWLIAIGFITRFRFSFFWWLALFSLVFFSVFLLNSVLEGNETNCFCFGELLQMSPGESLLKNLLLFILLLFVRKSPEHNHRSMLIVFVLSGLVALVAPVVVSPPDNLLPGRVTEAEMDQKAFSNAMKGNLMPANLASGKKLICFYSTACKFCRFSSGRVSATFRNHELDESAMFLVFLGNNPNAVLTFLEETDALDSDYSFMNQRDFLDITRGRVPLMVMTDNGRIVQVWNYRQFNEDEILSFFSDPNNQIDSFVP